MFKARYNSVVKTTVSGSTDVNKSMAHSEEHGKNYNGTENPIHKCSKFKNFKNKSADTHFKLPTRPESNLKRGTAIEFFQNLVFRRKFLKKQKIFLTTRWHSFPKKFVMKEKPTHTIMVRIILYRIYYTLGNFHFQIPYLKIFTTNLHSMIWKI